MLMKLRGSKPAALVLGCAFLTFATPSRPAPPRPWMPPSQTQTAPTDSAGKHDHRQVRWVNDVPDTGQFLPDTVLLARVAARTIRVSDYVDSYFNSYAEFRPRPDSAGRVEFLNSMINKEVLGLTALEINRPLGFEDRVVLREHAQRTLSNLLFQRAVLDSATVSEDEMRKAYEQHRYAIHMRRILFVDRPTANRVRADLVAGRITWSQAVRKYSTAPAEERAKDGDLGWFTRLGFDPVLAPAAFVLQPGGITPVMTDVQGPLLVQVVEKKPGNPPSYDDLRSMLKSEVRSRKVAERTEAVQSVLRGEIGMVHDTSNIEWASSKFTAAFRSGKEGPATTLDFDTTIPEFAPADTGRVLARHMHGQFTLGEMMNNYTALPPLMRPNVNDYESMRSFVDGVVLEPYMAELAVRRGLDKDSVAVRQLESRREELLVDHLYADSITSKVWIRPQDRRKYYNDHITGYVTFPHVTFAAFVRGSKGAADSLAARLRAGEKAADVLRADSLQGKSTGSIQQRSQNEHGTPYYKLLFEELRPGKVAIDGPDKIGQYAVIQLLSFDAGRQLSYEEAESYVDESLQNIRAEELLKEFIARRKKRYRIEAHPERLSQVLLVDRTLYE